MNNKFVNKGFKTSSGWYKFGNENSNSAYSLPLINGGSNGNGRAEKQNNFNQSFGRNTFYIPNEKKIDLLEVLPIGDPEATSAVAATLKRPNFQPEGRRRSSNM